MVAAAVAAAVFFGLPLIGFFEPLAAATSSIEIAPLSIPAVAA